jgi:hypothetical protein
MKKNSEDRVNGNMRSEYDFSSMKGGVRAKYYGRYRKGSNVVLLEPDVAKAFPTEDAVNQALRGILSTTRVVRRASGASDHARRGTSADKS